MTVHVGSKVGDGVERSDLSGMFLKRMIIDNIARHMKAQSGRGRVAANLSRETSSAGSLRGGRRNNADGLSKR